MSDRRYFALFYLRSGDSPRTQQEFNDLVALCGVLRPKVHSWRIDNFYAVTGEWGGLNIEAALLTLDHTRVLSLTFRQAEFFEMCDEPPGNVAADGAIEVVKSFRESCQKLTPLSALVSTMIFPPDYEVALTMEGPVVNHDVEVLCRERFYLLYVAPHDVQSLLRVDPLNHRDVFIAGDGLLVCGEGAGRWS